ncbi:MAG: hypothetical protein K0R48_673 [Gammaproteobacteria bacterium]|jgi:NTP pyrophosphatase (non-canonical NTP hydrolase)|nr:hypothetical protein [Gammaproteobacteria bacterium]
MKDIIETDKLKKILAHFADIRDWKKYHSPKNLSMAIAAEAGELLEIFQWMSESESLTIQHFSEVKEKVSFELADIVLYIIRIADLLDINLNESLYNKIAVNNDKYPADKVKGCAKKYTQYISDEN